MAQKCFPEWPTWYWFYRIAKIFLTLRHRYVDHRDRLLLEVEQFSLGTPGLVVLRMAVLAERICASKCLLISQLEKKEDELVSSCSSTYKWNRWSQSYGSVLQTFQLALSLGRCFDSEYSHLNLGRMPCSPTRYSLHQPRYGGCYSEQQDGGWIY